MVRINLLKKTEPNKAKRAEFPWRIIALFVGIVLIAGGGIATWYLMPKKVALPPQPVAIEQKTDFKPSTYVKPNMIEDVVREVNEERATKKTGLIDLTYDEMSFAEKINYEIYFAKNILDSIGTIIPAGIGLKLLEIDNFTTVYSIGLGKNSSIVAQTFSMLKSKLGLLPQPYSYIKENESKAYQFVFTCKPNFGVDLTNAYQPVDHLFSKDELSAKLSKVMSIATENSLRSNSKPVSITVQKIRDYQRFEYEWQCSGNYKNFVQFVNSIHQEQLPCAFKSIHITAKSGNIVNVTTRFIFTVKE